MKKVICLLTILFFKGFFLYAAQTINGPIGLVTMPSADSLKYREMAAAYDYKIGQTKEKEGWSYKVNLGTFQNWEIGIVGNKVPTEGMFLNIKYFLISDQARFPLSIALGFENLSSLTQTSFYMVASKKLRSDFGLHLGFKAIFDTAQIKPAIMGGAQYIHNDRIDFLADINSNGTLYTGNIAMHYVIVPDITARLSLLDIGDTLGGSRYGLGIAYSKFL